MTRVLVVEDEPSIALGLEDDLTLEGYEVVVVHDGNQGTKQALEHEFDVILLDVMMPGRNGFDVCRELRRRGVATPIILLTARTHEAEKVMGLELGADDYVTKPFSPAELRARIKAVIRRSPTVDASVYRFGGIEADFSRFELRRDGNAVHVTPIELKLLAAFVRNRGKVMRRAELKDDVWGTDVFMTDRVIDTHIANLRKKIEPDVASPKYIVSVRGVGYRFDG
jgi:DNA-binding response OmpR family regulator